MRPNHGMIEDDRKIDWLSVEDVMDQEGSVIIQHTLVGGGEYVVLKDPMEDLDNRPTLLVLQTIRLVHESATKSFNHTTPLL